MNPPRQAHIELADLVKDPTKLSDVDRAYIPALLTQLTAVQASMAAKLVAGSQEAASAPEDALLTVEDAADRLGVSEDWLYRRTRKLPFVVRVGRHVRFSSNGMDRYVRNRMGPK